MLQLQRNNNYCVVIATLELLDCYSNYSMGSAVEDDRRRDGEKKYKKT